jgi:cytochrome P450
VRYQSPYVNLRHSDELHDLPYLDKVVHEILRLDPPVAGTPRMASRDCVVPLENPVMGRDGKLMDSLKLRKGDQIYLRECSYRNVGNTLAIITVNRSTDIWGSDAGEFNPERFDKESPALQRIPGVYGNLMTFIGGPRNCM